MLKCKPDFTILIFFHFIIKKITGVYMKQKKISEAILDDVKNIGELLKSYRKERKITQEELANFSGLSRVGIVKLENNESDIKLSTLIKIVGLLGLDLVLKKRTIK